MRFNLITLLLFIASKSFAHRENTYFLKGNFGTKEVGVRIDEFGDRCFMRYFEVSDKVDHQMEGSIFENSQFVLHTISWNSAHTQSDTLETLRCHEVENHSWVGILTSKTGKKEEIQLVPIDMNSMQHPYFKGLYYPSLNINPYDAYRTQDAVFIPGEVEKMGKSIKIQWFTESRTGIQHFRLLSNKNATFHVDSMNRYLVAEQLSLVNQKYACIPENETPVFNTSTEVFFVNNQFLSYRISIQSNCNGTGTDDRTSIMNFNIATANEAMLEDIFWFGTSDPKTLRNGSQEWYQYRYKEFGQKITDLLEENYAKQMNDTTSGCDYKNVKRWQFPAWYLTQKGLYLEGSTLMEKPECKNTSWSTLPWKKLKEYYLGDQ